MQKLETALPQKISFWPNPGSPPTPNTYWEATGVKASLFSNESCYEKPLRVLRPQQPRPLRLGASLGQRGFLQRHVFSATLGRPWGPSAALGVSLSSTEYRRGTSPPLFKAVWRSPACPQKASESPHNPPEQGIYVQSSSRESEIPFRDST